MAKRESGWRPESFRAMALERMRTCNHIGRLCQELGVSRKTLEKWRRQMESRREAEPTTAPVAGETLEEENRRLKRALAEKVLEVDFLQGALRNIEARRRPNTASGARASTPRSGE
jgi:transposase-like protein